MKWKVLLLCGIIADNKALEGLLLTFNGSVYFGPL